MSRLILIYPFSPHEVPHEFFTNQYLALLEKAKLAREISDGKNEISHKFLGRKI